MSIDNVCPDPGRVAQLMTGNLPELEVDAICDHVLACPTCTTILRNLSGEQTVPYSAAPNSSSWITDPDDRATVELLIARWQELSPHHESNRRSESQIASTVGPLSNVSESATEIESKINLDELAKQLLRPPTAEGELGWLGSYRVLSVLGSGGMGVVFEAEDLRLGRRVAIKAMQPSLRGRQEHRRRFLREARAAASLDHDCIVPIHVVGEDRDVPFLVMPLLKGESLESRLRREGRLSVAETLRIGQQIATGIAAAHDRGLIHRDIKPANIWLEDRGQQLPRVKILDFGLARSEDDESALTKTGAVAGTPAFMAPEQARGDLTDARSDLFSLGCVLYCLLAGRPPFTGRNSAALVFAVISQTPDSLLNIEPRIPAGLAALVMRLFEKDPALRVQTANEVADALQSIEDGSQISDLIPDSTSTQQVTLVTAQPKVADRQQRTDVGRLPENRTQAVSGERISAGANFDSDHAIRRRTRLVAGCVAFAAIVTFCCWWWGPFRATATGITKTNTRVASALVPTANESAVSALPGMSIWLRADRGIETDANEGVRHWADQSAGQHHAEQVIAQSRPKLIPDALNSHAVVRFEGNNSFGLTGQLLHSQEFTVIAVASYLNLTQKVGSRILISNWDDLRTHNSVFLGVMDIDGVFPRFTDELAGDTDQYPEQTVRALINRPERHFLFTARSSKADAEVFINTDRHVGTGRPLSERDLSGKWRIGMQGAAFEHWSGDLAEMLVFDRALDENELHLVWNYLNERYFAASGRQPVGKPKPAGVSSEKQTLKTLTGNALAKADQPQKVLQSTVKSESIGDVPFPGLVPRPAQVTGLRRWQIETLAPRGDIFAVAWDPAGRRVACGSPTGNVRIIDLETSKTLNIIPAHTGPVWAIDWSPTEDRIVTAGDDGAVRLFDSSGKLRSELGSHTGTARSIAFSRDGTWIASGGYDSKVRLWRTTGQTGPVLSGHTSQVDGVNWHPSGKKLASASLDGTVRIWDLSDTWSANGIRGPESKGHLGGVLGLSWSYDGHLLASAGVDGTIILSTSDGKQHSVLNGHGNAVTAVTWSATGLIATSGEDQTVRLWQQDGTPLKTLKVEAGRINDLEWSRDGSRLAVATGSQGIRFLNASGEWDGEIPLDTVSMRAIAFNGAAELATAGDGGFVGIWKPDLTRKIQLKGHTKTVYSVAWNPNGTQLMSAGWNSPVNVWNASGETIATHPGTNPTAWNPMSGEAAWTSGTDVQFPSADMPLRVLGGHKAQVVRLVWNPDGTRLASADVNGEIRLWDRDGSPTGVLQSDSMVLGLAWHPQRPILASGSTANGKIRLWGTDGKVIKEWNGHIKGLMALDWSPDGQRLISSAYDQRVRIWDETGNSVGELPGPMAIACTAAWNPTGKQIATTHVDGSICLWDGSTLQPESKSVCFKDGNWARFDSHGLSSSSDPATVDGRFVAIAEDESGVISIVKLSDFRAKQAPPGKP